jgi:hypothetical protein
MQITKKSCVRSFWTNGVKCWHPVQCSYMTLWISIQLLSLHHYYSISTGSCLTTFLTILILLRVTTICLPTWRTGCDHSASTITRSWGTGMELSSQKTWLLWHRSTKRISRYKCLNSSSDWLHWEHFLYKINFFSHCSFCEKLTGGYFPNSLCVILQNTRTSRTASLTYNWMITLPFHWKHFLEQCPVSHSTGHSYSIHGKLYHLLFPSAPIQRQDMKVWLEHWQATVFTNINTLVINAYVWGPLYM